MQVLDQRFNNKQQQQPAGVVAKKVRSIGEPSDYPPPPGAPLWAIKKDFHNQSGNYVKWVHSDD